MTLILQNGENRVYIQEESEEQENLILIAADYRITLRPLLCFGTTVLRGRRIIGTFVQKMPRFTTDKLCLWEDRLERTYLLFVLLKSLILFSKTLDPL